MVIDVEQPLLESSNCPGSTTREPSELTTVRSVGARVIVTCARSPGRIVAPSKARNSRTGVTRELTTSRTYNCTTSVPGWSPRFATVTVASRESSGPICSAEQDIDSYSKAGNRGLSAGGRSTSAPRSGAYRTDSSPQSEFQRSLARPRSRDRTRTGRRRPVPLRPESPAVIRRRRS